MGNAFTAIVKPAQQLQIQKGEQLSELPCSVLLWFDEITVFADCSNLSVLSMQGMTLATDTTTAIMKANNLILAKIRINMNFLLKIIATLWLRSAYMRISHLV